MVNENTRKSSMLTKVHVKTMKASLRKKIVVLLIAFSLSLSMISAFEVNNLASASDGGFAVKAAGVFYPTLAGYNGLTTSQCLSILRGLGINAMRYANRAVKADFSRFIGRWPRGRGEDENKQGRTEQWISSFGATSFYSPPDFRRLRTIRSRQSSELPLFRTTRNEARPRLAGRLEVRHWRRDFATTPSPEMTHNCSKPLKRLAIPAGFPESDPTVAIVAIRPHGGRMRSLGGASILWTGRPHPAIPNKFRSTGWP